MKTISMSGSIRESVGKKGSKALRNQGKVPCVLYGGEKQIHFSTDASQFKNLIYSPEIAFVELDLEGNKVSCILQDVQFHVVTGNIMHADFLKIDDDKPIIMGVPIQTTGSSAGVIKGGVLNVLMRKVRVKALPGNMPEEIVLDITPLEIGDSIKIKQIETNNFELLDSENAVVVGIRVTRAAASAAASGVDDEEGDEGAEGADAPAESAE
jgi:large subunit ribosomal protein L25